MLEVRGTEGEDEAQRALAELAPIAGLLRASLEAGVADANGCFSERGWGAEYDVWLHAHLVRATAKHLLTASGLTCTDDTVTEPAMSGILVQYGSLFVKIRKSVDGLPPVPTSDAAAAFYEQQSMLPDLRTTNLLLLWRTVDDRLGPLLLVKPARPAGGRRRGVEIEWQVLLPRPRGQAAPPQGPGAQAPGAQAPRAQGRSITLSDWRASMAR
jgi:hypothetical protein